MKRAVVILLLVFLALDQPAQAFQPQTSKHTLDNGMTLLVREMPENPMVAVYALVRTGSATEGEFLGTGISHFLEHMLFKGTEKRGPREIPAEIQSVGGSVNASTSHDYTMYTVTVPAEAFGTGLDVLSDMLQNATLEPREIEKERQVIFKEMKMHNDNPDRRLNRLAFESVYIRHPYRHPVIGYKELLAGVSRQDLVDYYRLHYAPNNIILSVAGGIDREDVVHDVEQAFKSFQRRREVPRDTPSEPQQVSSRQVEEEYPNTDLTRLSMAFSGVSLLDRDLFALDVLAQILGQGRSSRLYVDLYKRQGLVHSIASFNFTPVDRGVFGIEALLEEKDVDRVIEASWDHIRAIQNKGVSSKELDKAKQQVMSDYVFGNQTVSRVAWAQALDEAFTGDPRFSSKYVDKVRDVDNDDIKRVARTYLRDEHLTVVVLRPQMRDDEPLPASEEDKPLSKNIERLRLKNGLTVLLKKQDTFPLVSVRLSMVGGLRQEPEDLNGISELTASTWIKGAGSRDAHEIFKLTDGRGMRLSGGSGKNSISLSMDFLAEDFDVAFDLLEDFAFDPLFPRDEIKKTKENMRVSLRQRDEDIGRFTGFAMKQALFERHPYRLDENGTPESLERIAREDILDFYQRLAVPRNMVLSIFGNFDREKVLGIIEKRFSGLQDRSLALKSYQEEPITQPKEMELYLDKEQAMVMIGFQAPAIFSQDRYPLEVVTAILGSSFSGRMFNNIREELGEAYTLGGSYIPGIDAGMVYFYVLTTDEKVKTVKGLMENEIRKIQSEPVSDQELLDIKRYLKGNFKAGLQTVSALNATASLDELYGLGYDHYAYYGNLIDKVSKDDVTRVASKYLNLGKKVAVVTRPPRER